MNRIENEDLGNEILDFVKSHVEGYLLAIQDDAVTAFERNHPDFPSASKCPDGLQFVNGCLYSMLFTAFTNTIAIGFSKKNRTPCSPELVLSVQEAIRPVLDRFMEEPEWEGDEIQEL